MDGRSFICWFKFPNLWQGTSSHQGNIADYSASGFPPPGPARLTVTRRPETTESCFLIRVNGLLLFGCRAERHLHCHQILWWSQRGNMVQKPGKLTVNMSSVLVRLSSGNPHTNKGHFNCIYQLSAKIT